MSDVMSDEALARRLQQEEDDKLDAIYQNDLALAQSLQQESVVDLTSDHSDCEDEETQKNFWLALNLQQQEDNKQNKNYDQDFELAKQLQNQVDDSILDQDIPDVHELFMFFNKKYFHDMLTTVDVRWSHKMTRCAGTCTYMGMGNCTIALSEPILKFRPKKDMFETLLHEMIHALLFITQNNTDRDGHGPEFLKEAARISKAANLKITVYHNFHDEVDHYLTHVWKCNGPCQDRPPYFGIVKRSVNRPPQRADTWFADHETSCGGSYTKISAPPSKEKTKSGSKRKTIPPTLDNYFKDCDQKMKKFKEFE